MKYFIILLLGVVLCVPLAAQPDTLTILHVNDTHSALMPLAPRQPDLSGQRGGIARVASFVGQTKMSEPNVLFLHAGDLSIGDPMYNLYYGVPEYVILSQLGLDAMTVGNHEFDLTPAALQGALDAASAEGFSFPLLSANIHLEDAAVVPLKTYVIPHTIRTFEGIKVGIFGLTTPMTELLSLPSPAVIDTNLGTIAAAQVEALVAETCDVVILLSHLGLTYDRMIAEYVPGIDLIVGGHDHELFTEAEAVTNISGDTTWVVQSGAFYECVGKTRLVIDASGVTFVDYVPVLMDESIPEAPEISDLLAAQVSQLEAVTGIGFFSQQIAVATETQTELLTDLTSRREASTNVARLLTKAIRHAVPGDIAITACGATSQPIAAGPVTPADLYRAIGYGFNENDGLGYRLTTYVMTGLDLIMGLEFGLSTIEENDEFFVVGDPLLYYYDPGKPAYARLDSAFIGNLPIDPAREYTVVSSEYILGFMNDFLAPQLGLTIKGISFYDETEFSALYAYVDDVKILSGDSISVINDVTDPLSVPADFVLHQNFPNPFNPTTSISFSMPASGFVDLAVFDILGREIRKLVSEIRPAGTYSVTWNAEVPSGMYFYRMRVTNQVGRELFGKTQRMVVMR